MKSLVEFIKESKGISDETAEKLLVKFVTFLANEGVKQALPARILAVGKEEWTVFSNKGVKEKFKPYLIDVKLDGIPVTFGWLQLEDSFISPKNIKNVEGKAKDIVGDFSKELLTGDGMIKFAKDALTMKDYVMGHCLYVGVSFRKYFMPLAQLIFNVNKDDFESNKKLKVYKVPMSPDITNTHKWFIKVFKYQFDDMKNGLNALKDFIFKK